MANLAPGSPAQRADRRARSDNRRRMDLFSGNDPERQANIAFILIFLGIIFVGGLTIWLFYGATF